ncbi:DUF2721 domain-containing protein [Azospira restricta]|uniref:DUF2721 domain-containing protein n=1 Tax=Azospira restricta TaxID=404405 RepID=A0A974PWJ0_9RHOO|nr:DUF2721 domain-containing protein [Azospira restricta]QRJ62787.1 DUF2721 domain-containing protein [Azospira restricta]
MAVGDLSDIAHVIQLAVAPVFLLTAIATLINAMNGRLGRIVDRRRVVAEQLRHPGRDDCAEAEAEMAMLGRRSRLVYLSILFAVLSALLVCLVVAGAFVGAMVAVKLAHAVAGLFVAAMLAMIVSLSVFLREIYLAVTSGTHYRR